MKTHIIENGIITNTIMASVEEAQSAFPHAVCIDAVDGAIGWSWDGETATPPAPVEPVSTVPQVVTIRQGIRALYDAGLLDDVEAAVAQADRPTQIDWERATEFRRDWPTLIALQLALGLTDAQVDALFIAAAAIE